MNSRFCDEKMKVAVIGLGVGYALACCLAEAGYNTLGLDIDPTIVANPRRDPSISAVTKAKSSKIRVERNLRLTTSYDDIANCTHVIVCVSTGDEKKLVLGHVEGAVHKYLTVIHASKPEITPLLMIYSTLPYGSSKKIREVFKSTGVAIDRDVGYVHFPLMIAQGTTANDFVNPPFVVFGSDSKVIAKKAMDFYKRFIKRSCLFTGKLPPMFIGTPEEAELAKLCANAFLTTKIGLANEFGNLFERLGMDGQKVMSVVGSDWRIGRKFTTPAYAVGGSCFPRDLKSLIETYDQTGTRTKILRAVDEANADRLNDPLDKIQGSKVLVLGKSYKPSITETKGSPSIALADALKNKGYQVEMYDPKFGDPLPSREYDTIIVTVTEPMFRNLQMLAGKCRVVLDYTSMVDQSTLPRTTRLWRAGSGWANYDPL